MILFKSYVGWNGGWTTQVSDETSPPFIYCLTSQLIKSKKCRQIRRAQRGIKNEMRSISMYKIGNEEKRDKFDMKHAIV